MSTQCNASLDTEIVDNSVKRERKLKRTIKKIIWKTEQTETPSRFDKLFYVTH